MPATMTRAINASKVTATAAIQSVDDGTYRC